MTAPGHETELVLQKLDAMSDKLFGRMNAMESGMNERIGKLDVGVARLDERVSQRHLAPCKELTTLTKTVGDHVKAHSALSTRAIFLILSSLAGVGATLIALHVARLWGIK